MANKNAERKLEDYSSALRSKLDAAGYFHAKCKEIVQRLPEAIGREERLEDLPLSIDESLIAQAQVFLECFFYFTTSALDILAKLSRELFPRSRRAMGSRYFKQTINFFTTIDTKLDPEFTRILKENQDWILEIYRNRDLWAHSGAAFVLYADEEGNIVFDNHRSLQDLPTYLDRVIIRLENFLTSCITQFRTMVPETDSTRRMRKALRSSSKPDS